MSGCGGPSQDTGGGLSRRQLIAGSLAGLALLAGMSGCRLRLEGDLPPTPAASPPPSAEERAREVVAAQSDQLAATVNAVRRRRSPAAPAPVVLTLLAEHHRAHARALRPAPASAPIATTPASGPSITTPASARADVHDLVAAERVAARSAIEDLASVTPGSARLLAAIAAARSVHADLLGAQPVAAAASPSAPVAPGERAALSAVLEGESAAAYAYGVVGAQGSDADRERALERLSWHSRQRDLITARLAAAGVESPGTPPAYALPFRVSGVNGARRLAAHVEKALAATYADLIAAAAPTNRRAAAGQLAWCAVHARRWGAAAQAFPGMAERS